MTVLWVIAVLLCVYVVWMFVVPLASRHHPKRYPLVKGAESALFVACGLLAFYAAAPRNGRDFALLFPALLLCMAGDIFLAFTTSARRLNHRAFLAGGLCFFVAHLLLIVLFYRYAPFKIYDLVLPSLALSALYWLDETNIVSLHGRGSIRALAYCYAGVVALMTAEALEAAIVFFTRSALWGVLVGLGGALFFVSDLFLLFVYFGRHRKFWMKVVNLATYFSGVMMLALSAYWM